MKRILPASARRRRTQKGLESIEFGLWALLMLPPFIWMFINGFNFIRYNKAGDVTRSAAMMYVKNTDMMSLTTQRIVERVANGLDLQVDSGNTIVNNIGNGLVVLTKLQYVGSTCNCTNADQYVMTQRIYIGNRSMQITGAGVESFAGPAPTAIWNSSTGLVSSYTTDSAARASTAFATAWGSSLANGQVVYLVESFFKTLSFGTGDFDARGVYTRVYM